MSRVEHISASNIVTQNALREVQLNTLSSISSVLEKTYGPMGSNTLILKGNSKETLVAEYSKDGNKVLKAISFSDPIEMSIQSQIRDITDFVDKNIGDGTTSATLLSTEVFCRLCNMKTNANPYQIIKVFQKVVSDIKEKILEKKQELTLEKVYDLCMISTNGNEQIADVITNEIYGKYGFEVFVDTAISNCEEDVIRVFDGLTLDEGYSDVAYINRAGAKCEIDNPSIYAFNDPIDTMELSAFLDQIIMDNIFKPVSEGHAPIPTVIVAPKISRDVAPIIEKLCEFLLSSFDSSTLSDKPPILIVTNLLGGNLDKYYDICKLCGCKMIRKYIDPKIQQKDIENGVAPTPETIHNFAGHCRKVSADSSDTKFINPSDMYESDENGLYITDENGQYVPTSTYSSLLQFVKDAEEEATRKAEDVLEINRLRKRLQSLKANYVEYMVGGISIADREAKRDLVQDAIRNCRSAAKEGIGYAANFEGLRAAQEVLSASIDGSVEKEMTSVIFDAYKRIVGKLYETYDKEKVDYIINTSFQKKMPFNIRTGEYDGKVITSIMTDVYILDAISKIVTIMFTANQCLVQAPQINVYQ